LNEASQYRLTVLQENAGCGKSTALVSFIDQAQNTIWYQVTDDDTNLPLFLMYLLKATEYAIPGIQNLPISLLENWEVARGPLPSKLIINQLLNSIGSATSDPVFLVLDDIHLIQDSTAIAHVLDHLISLAPSNIHFLLSSRHPVSFPNMFRWASRGEILLLDQNLLAFTPEEVASLYTENYDFDLLPDEIEALTNTTEGWALALQLIWQGLKSGAVSSVEDAISYQASTMDNLFAVLTHEVLEKQSEDIQEFLQASSVLRSMSPAACDAIRQKDDSAAILSLLQRQDLFVVETGNDILRYQHIFHQFLKQLSSETDKRFWHSLAADYYREQNDVESAIYHALKIPDYSQAAELLVQYGEDLIRTGLLDTLSYYLEKLPPDLLLSYSALLKQLGDIARFKSQFHQALGWYKQAETIFRERGETKEVGRCLRDQARVYIDTVDPNNAAELLQKALRLSDGTEDRQSTARLYELLAENKLNAGKPDEAEEYQRQAESIREEGHSVGQLHHRVLIRTGQLKEARSQLEQQAEEERNQPVHTSRSHRETLLLLSLIYGLQGDVNLSLNTAIQGTLRGEELGSPWVTAVGHMRQGHALMLLQEEHTYTAAKDAFEKAIEISRSLSTPRLRVEAYWGLCRVYGYSGDLDQATQIAHRAIKIAEDAGDVWIASLVRLAMGASLVQAQSYEIADAWLNDAFRGFIDCSDPLGASAVRLWTCLGLLADGNHDRLAQETPLLLDTCQKNQYDFLFTKPTILGIPDQRACIPLLIQSRDHGWRATYARQLLSEMNVPGIRVHPGYQLRVETLGKFQAWLGKHPIPSNGWQRSKSRQLFQLLITYYKSLLDREQIYEYLWPGGVIYKTEQNFKVTLSTLYRILEPNRKPGSESAYVERKECSYRIRDDADIWIDFVDFEKSLDEAESISDRSPEKAISIFEQSLLLYKGDYLPNSLYETWSAAKRELLSVQFLRGADRLCELYLEHNRPEETITVCQRIFEEDTCWERAYRHLMSAYARLGDHGQIARTYQRCIQTMQEELNISPSPETEIQYQKLISSS
jgi:ATP/maltotriose-dependent transcriptional regulator MalT/DNA-binding SARP family transcriptional activator